MYDIINMEVKNMKLKIVESSWSGWSKDYKPEKVEKEYKIFDALKLFIGQLKKAQDDANKILKFEIN